MKLKKCVVLKSKIGALGLIFLAACSSNPLKKSDNPEIVFNEGSRLYDKGDYMEATEFFNEIRHRFPQSRFAAMAELRSADVEFAQDNYTEAAAAYGTFLDLYPTHPQAAYALYQRGLAYFNDTPGNIARDQATAGSAAASSDQLMKRYPNSEYVEKAKDIYQKSRIRLAEKEAYIARFYERREAPLAAFRRWEGIKASYSDLAEFKEKPEALALIREAEKHSDALAPQLEKSQP